MSIQRRRARRAAHSRAPPPGMMLPMHRSRTLVLIAYGAALAPAAPAAGDVPLRDDPRARAVALSGPDVLVARTGRHGRVAVDALPRAGGAARRLLTVPAHGQREDTPRLAASPQRWAALVQVEAPSGAVESRLYAGSPGGPASLVLRSRWLSRRAWVPIDVAVDGEQLLLLEVQPERGRHPRAGVRAGRGARDRAVAGPCIRGDRDRGRPRSRSSAPSHAAATSACSASSWRTGARAQRPTRSTSEIPTASARPASTSPRTAASSWRTTAGCSRRDPAGRSGPSRRAVASRTRASPARAGDRSAARRALREPSGRSLVDPAGGAAAAGSALASAALESLRRRRARRRLARERLRPLRAARRRARRPRRPDPCPAAEVLAGRGRAGAARPHGPDPRHVRGGAARRLPRDGAAAQPPGRLGRGRFERPGRNAPARARAAHAPRRPVRRCAGCGRGPDPAGLDGVFAGPGRARPRRPRARGARRPGSRD